MRYWNAPIYGIQESISRLELGILEGTIKDLEEVFILSDIVEEPTGKLYESVVTNLKKDVRYTFLISKSKYLLEKNKYYKIFEAIAESNNLKESVNIRPLNIEWNKFPCIFYKLSTGYIFAYMGNDEREGIAEGYDFIGPQMAVKLLELANFAASVDVTKILSFEQTNEKVLFVKTPNLN